MKRNILKISRLGLPAAMVVALWLSVAGEPQAQRMGIIATVNNTPISEYDLQARMSIVMAFSGLPRNQQTVRDLAPKVVQILIEEELKRQEAENLGIEISEADVDIAVRQFEEARNMSPGGLNDMMARLGLGEDAIRQQIEADLGWNRALRARFRALTTIPEEEVDEEIARMEANKGQPVVLLSEIYLPVDTPDKEPEVKQMAGKILGELQRGVRFPALASTFSQSATAAVGGDLGWVPFDSLPSETQTALSNMQVGEISEPIRTNAGYRIVWYREQRVSQGASGPAVDPKIDLQQVFIPVDNASSASEVGTKMSLARRLALRSDSCEAMASLPNRVAGGLTESRSNLRMSQLAPNVRDTVKDLPDGQVSAPLKVPGAILLFMICEREVADVEQLQRENVRERLINERLNLAARQYLRDLKRSAFIEQRRR